MERVKYFTTNDFCYGMGLSKIETMAIPNYDNIDINDAIEFYQIKRYFDDDIKPIDGPENWKEQFSEKSLELYKLTFRFFNSISNENIVSQYSIVDTNYTTAFWELFNNCKLYGKISEIEFEKIIRLKNINLYDILVHKNTVQKYGEIIKNVITDELEYVRILIDFYEQNYSQRKKIYLPDELTENDIVKMLSDYLDSETANTNCINAISQMKSTKRFPIEAELRLKAKHKYEEKIKEITKQGVTISHGISLAFSPEQIEEKKFDFSNETLYASYSTKWLLDTLDYPSILNNFIYIFEFADVYQMRCTLTSKRSNIDIFEHIGLKELSSIYPESFRFHSINNLAQRQMIAYTNLLSENNICFENVLKWVFTEYLQNEFQCSEIKLDFPDANSNYSNKCVSLAIVIDSLLKQFDLFQKHKKIDFELLAISHGSKPFIEIKSLVKNKYIYGTGSLFINLSHLLFSNQSLLAYIPRLSNQGKEYDTLFEVLSNEEIYVSDFMTRDISALNTLEKENLIIISDNGKISFGDNLKVLILKDLYKNEVISRYHYSKNAEPVFNEWIQKGILIEGDSLFSIPECEYFNYILNDSQFVNRLEIRNKYIHGVQSGLNDDNHKNNYYILLKILTIIAIKLNDDFCLYEQLKENID